MKKEDNQDITGSAPFLPDSLIMTIMPVMTTMKTKIYTENDVEKRKKIRISLAALLFPLTA